MTKAPFTISKRIVWRAYKRIKANRGAAGVDGESLEVFEEDLENNLYKIWNRMSSGSYFPPPVRLVEIPKGATGKVRPLGIPTVSDRIAQIVVKMCLEPHVEPHFHKDSYGYRPKKSALQAVAVTRKRCWRLDWVVDLDIKGFFDNLDHNLVMRAVRRHTRSPWILLYVERWLKAPVQKEDGSLEKRTKGSPQGSVISPLLANLFMHYAFDEWLRRNYPRIQFARYADDAVVHTKSLQQATFVLKVIQNRLRRCGLELHPEKTRIVYCQDSNRTATHEHVAFDFLGFTFQPRRAKNARGETFVCHLPAISKKAANSIRATIRSWRLGARRNNQSLEEIAELVNPYVRGWVIIMAGFTDRPFTQCCAASTMHSSPGCSANTNDSDAIAIVPFTGWAGSPAVNRTCSYFGTLEFDLRLGHKSRMNREVHVRFCEGLGVQFPRATRPMINIKAMKTDGRAKALLRKTSPIKLPRTDVPPRLPLIAKPLGRITCRVSVMHQRG